MRFLKTTLSLYLLITTKTLVHGSTSLYFEKSCEGEYCPRFLQKPDDIPSCKYTKPVTLGQDPETGCTCRVDRNNFTICFGPDHCTGVPKTLNITSANLKITNTLIKTLYPGSFSKLHHLMDLRIEGNPYLETVLPGTFMNMSKLRNLSISFNMNLQYLHSESFVGLVNVRLIFLTQNNLNNLAMVAKSLSVSSVPQLDDLSVVENVFHSIEENDFKPMANSKLTHINLSLCRLQYLHPKSLLPLKMLKVLKLSDNQFSSSSITAVLNETIEARIPLEVLVLFNLAFRKTPPTDLLEAISRSNITHLALVKNQFEYLGPNSFPFYSPNLESLDLREVSLLDISPKAFRNLPNLRTLLLSGNKLAIVPNNTLPKTLVFLDLQSSRINAFIPSYFVIPRGVFTNMSKLRYMNLGYNSIETLRPYSFSGLIGLKVLILRNASLFDVEENSFASLESLEYLYLENTFFIRLNPGRLNPRTFGGLRRLKELRLDNCGLTYINQTYSPFTELVSLERLSLADNGLKTLSPNDFKQNRALKILDLSDNQLVPWEERVFASNVALRCLVLSKNKISYVGTSMLYDFANLTRLKIYDNPFGCFCVNYYMFDEWYAVTKNGNFLNKTIVGRPYCGFPSFLTNMTITDFFRSVQNKTIECGPLTSIKSLVKFLPLALVLAALVLLGLFSYYYRWHLRYWVFLSKLYLSRKGKIRTSKSLSCVDKSSYIYDAFVSYSSEDRQFVILLIKMLETQEPFLKLCVYERDFEIGTIISENVLQCVAKSRKTVLIISDNYARSQWCRWETQIAEHHRLFFENEQGEYVDDSLILIKFGAVSRQNLTPTLRYLLKTRIYLQWDELDERKQRSFWNRLRKTLAPPEGAERFPEISHM